MENNETVKIVNLKQATLYIKHGVKPINVYVGFKDKLIFEFNKVDTEDLFTKWCNYQLN